MRLDWVIYAVKNGAEVFVRRISNVTKQTAREVAVSEQWARGLETWVVKVYEVSP